MNTPFIYTGLLVGHAPHVNRYIHFLTLLIYFIFYILRAMSGGYNSGGQHLARLWDSAMAHRTHMLPIRRLKCRRYSASFIGHGLEDALGP